MGGSIANTYRVRVKPGRPAVDWSDRLSDGLVWCVAPCGHVARELVSPSHPAGTLNTSSESWRGGGLAGRCLSVGGAAGGAYWPQTPALATIGTEATILALVEPTSAAANAGLWVVPYRNETTWTSPYVALQFSYDAAGHGQFAVSDSGAFEYFCPSASGFPAAGDGTPALLGVTRRGASVTFYKNGAVHSTATLTSPNGGTNAAGAVPYFGNGQDVNVMQESHLLTSNVALTGRLHVAYVWKRALAEAEMLALQEDAHRLVRRVPARVVATPAVAGIRFRRGFSDVGGQAGRRQPMGRLVT
jgi:hypothetical protein